MTPARGASHVLGCVTYIAPWRALHARGILTGCLDVPTEATVTIAILWARNLGAGLRTADQVALTFVMACLCHSACLWLPSPSSQVTFAVDRPTSPIDSVKASIETVGLHQWQCAVVARALTAVLVGELPCCRHADRHSGRRAHPFTGSCRWPSRVEGRSGQRPRSAGAGCSHNRHPRAPAVSPLVLSRSPELASGPGTR